MDLSFASLATTLMLSVLGFAFFLYGKKAQRPFPLMAGLAMSIYPFFITNLLLIWGLTGFIIAGLFVLRDR